MQALSGETYDFSAKPKVVNARSKYREQQMYEEEEGDGKFQNMMFDKRVVRGNTYAAIVTSSKNTEQFKDTTKLVRSLKKPQKQQYEVEVQQDYEAPGTPEAVHGRVHAGLQTDEYVETLTDKPPNYEKDTQTDFYIDRPLVRQFLPKKEGIDKEVQIWDGDLFDFDYEVEPILQVLIGKTLEQSRMEVLEEEELRIMKEQQKRFEQLRNAELAEMQKLEAKEQRLQQESESRVKQYAAKKDQHILTHKKLIGRVLAKDYLNKLQPNVVGILKEQGVFRHPLQTTLLHKFLPWIYDEVQKDLEQKNGASSQIATLLSNGFAENQSIHKQFMEKEKIRREEELERRRLEQEAKEARIAKRKEEKRIRLENERRERLKQQALEQLVAKGEQRPNILSLSIADIDNHAADAPPIGLFGGLLGEVLLFSGCLANLGTEEGQYAGLKEWISGTENIVAIFKDLVQQVCTDGGLEIQIDENVEQQIQALFPQEEGEEPAEPQTLGNWHLAPEEKINEINEILKQNIAHLTLNTIKANAEELQINTEVIDECILSLLRLIYQEDSIQSKVKWVKVAPKQKFDEVGVAWMKPALDSLMVNSRSERFGETQEVQNEEEEGAEPQEPKPVVPKNLAEADYENKQTCFAQGNEEIKVLTQHAIAELVIRDEILKSVSQQVSSVAGLEFQILMESTDIMRATQQKILDYLSPEYPVLDMDSY